MRDRGIVHPCHVDRDGRRGARRSIACRIGKRIGRRLPGAQSLHGAGGVVERIAVATVACERQRAVGAGESTRRRHGKHGAVHGITWSFKENVAVAVQAPTYAQRLLSDNKRQVAVGTLPAPSK